MNFGITATSNLPIKYCYYYYSVTITMSSTLFAKQHDANCAFDSFAKQLYVAWGLVHAALDAPTKSSMFLLMCTCVNHRLNGVNYEYLSSTKRIAMHALMDCLITHLPRYKLVVVAHNIQPTMNAVDIIDTASAMTKTYKDQMTKCDRAERAERRLPFLCAINTLKTADNVKGTIHNTLALPEIHRTIAGYL